MKTAAGTGLALAACNAPVEPPRFDEVTAQIRDLAATYDNTIETVTLTWTPPAADIEYYMIYRTSDVDENGVPANMKSEGLRSRVSADSVRFLDIIGTQNATYYYQIRVAVRTATAIVEGPKSNIDSATVFPELSFSINYGDIYLTKDTCFLVVLDYKGLLQSTRFSNDSVFENVQPLSQRSITGGTEYTWVLPKGGGDKTVFAEVTFKDGRVDTLSDEIRIKPYQVAFKLRNEIRKPYETMKALDESGWTPVSLQGKKMPSYVVYKPCLQFSIIIYSDESFEQDFVFSILFPDSSVRIIDAPTCIAMPYKKERLTGIGKVHDDNHVYTFDFSPDIAQTDPSSESARNLSRFFITSGYGADTASAISNENLRNAYETLTRLGGQGGLFGRKEFTIVARFKGRYFGEERIAYSSAFLWEHGTIVSYFDCYPPLVKADRFDVVFPVDGSTIEQKFTLNTNSEGGTNWDVLPDDIGGEGDVGFVRDGGGADIKSAELVLAEMPDSLVAEWDKAAEAENQAAAVAAISKSITYEQLMSYRHRVIPFDIPVPVQVLFSLRWEDVDVTTWNNGWHLMCILIEDIYGNKGIAPFKANPVTGQQITRFNPQRWYIVTGNNDK